jgi:hypothetical protein
VFAASPQRKRYFWHEKYATPFPDENLAGALPQQMLAKPPVLACPPRSYAAEWPWIAEILAKEY